MYKFWGLLVLFLISFANCTERYKDSLFEIEKKTNLVYVQDIPFFAEKHAVTLLASGLKMESDDVPILHFYQNANNTTNVNLQLDLFLPQKDSAKNRPLVIMLHGGAFVSGSRDDRSQSIIGFCDSLAVRGYVVASIDYRIGLVLKNNGNQLLVDSLDFKRAIQWGVQDLQNAVHYFKIHADTYGVDPEKFFVIGNSSGAILALHFGIENEDSVRGIVSLWGATIDSLRIKNIITPMLLVHGTKDNIIPFTKGRMLDIDSVRNENRFMPGYASAASIFNLKFLSPIFFGSFIIDSVLATKHVAHETFFIEGLGHEIYNREPYKTNILNRIVEFFYKLVMPRF